MRGAAANGRGPFSAKLRKSSGHSGYDQAVERAILKSSPLPKPDPQALFERALELKFRPQDKQALTRSSESS